MDVRGGSLHPLPVTALTVSAAIDPVLREGAQGVVIRRHRRALDIRVGGEGIVLLAASLGDEPHGIRIDDFEAAASAAGVSEHIAVLGGELLIGSRVSISLRAPRWQPQLHAISPAGPRRWDVALAGIHAAGPVRPQLVDGHDRIARLVADLRGALARRDDASATAAGMALIGLGPGLTPAGDDVLVGLTATLRALGDARCDRLARAWACHARGRTTDLAAIFHGHAARGNYARRIHDLLAALLVGPPSGVASAVGRVAGWGATSGRDTLHGVEIALDATQAARRMAA